MSRRIGLVARAAMEQERRSHETFCVALSSVEHFALQSI